jgi:hypothetical protein
MKDIRLPKNFQDQPGTLLEGIFVTLSISRSELTKWLYLSQVRRYGSMAPPDVFSWTTASVPLSIYHWSCDTLRSHFDEMLTRNFGIEQELPL